MDFSVRIVVKIFSCVLMLHVIPVGSGEILAQHVLVSDIVAGYKTNASLFQGSRTSYKLNVEEKFGDSFFSFERAYDYWSDSQNVLIRGGDSEVISNSNDILGGQLPSQVSSADLETIYKAIPVISYDSDGKLWYRWSVTDKDSGQNKEGRGEIIGNTDPLSDDDRFFYPPFQSFGFDKIESVFPTDAFFSGSESDMYLLGTQIIDNVEYYVVETRVLNPDERYQFQDDDMNFCSIQRAWIDIKKGCIPVRIESLSALYKNGQFIDYETSLQFSESDTSLTSIFEVQEIQKKGIGFYPARATQRFLGLSRKTNNEVGINENSVVAVNDFVFALEVYMKRAWEVSNIILDVAIDRETIVLPFPKGTVIFDDRSDRIRLAGMTEKEFEQMLMEQSRMHGVVPDSGMVFPDPDSKWVPEDFIPRPPHGKGAAFFIIGVNLVALAFILRYILLSLKQRKKEK